MNPDDLSLWDDELMDYLANVVDFTEWATVELDRFDWYEGSRP